MNAEAVNRWEVDGQAFLEVREESVSDQQVVMILIVHPDRLFREALAIALAGFPKALTVVACIADVNELAKQGTQPPDVVLLGGQTRAIDLYRQAVQLRGWYASARVLLMDESVGAVGISRTQAQDQTGLIHLHHDNGSFQGLLQQVRRLGRECSSRPSALGVVEPNPHKSAVSDEYRLDQDWFGLTQREEEILHLRSNGVSNKEVAVTLHIGVQTVKNHVRNLYTKLRLHGRRVGMPSRKRAQTQGVVNTQKHRRNSLVSPLDSEG